MKRGLCAALLTLCALLAACARTPSAPEPAKETEPRMSDAAIAVPTAAPKAPWPELRLYFDGLLRGRGYEVEGTAYIPVGLICGYYGLEWSAESDGNTLHLCLPGVDLYGVRGQDYMEAEGRWLYTPGDWLEADGEIYLPLAATEHLFGLAIDADEALTRCDVGSTGCRFLQGGENYYALHWSNEDLYWLTHIIYAEAHWEPLAGQIGVGNVVLNRVQSGDFPATITTVVLDQEDVHFQFDPVTSREVLAEPDETAVIAACLCLEGYNTVGGALYFVNPERGEDAWFRQELTEVAVIGSHHFYM